MSDSSTQGQRYIYALWCPLTEQYRYVGMTRNIEGRFAYHLAGGDLGSRRSWILALKRMGMRPIMAIVDVVPVDVVYRIEGRWMREMLDRGHALTNATIPGRPRRIVPPSSFSLEDWVLPVAEDMAAVIGTTPDDVVEMAVRELAKERDKK